MFILETAAAGLSYVLPFIAMIVVLVTLHEWGHYYAAKTIGVKVTHFSIGMGPVLWSRTDRDDCIWQVCLFPVGGFVRFLGDRDGSSASMNPDDASGAVALTAAERRKYFGLRKPADRAFVILAGPALNLILGLIIISTLYVAHGRPHIAPVIADVVAGLPAETAGVKAGDRVTSINGIDVSSFADIYEEIALRPGEAIHLEVLRDVENAPVHLEFDMVSISRKIDTFGVAQTAGQIGILSTGVVETEQVGPITALIVGADDVWQLTKGMLIGLSQIVSGSRPLDDIGGPVKMAEMSGNAYQAGFTSFIFLVAAISINLGVMNLFPLPVLDGGQLVVCAVEMLTRRPVSGMVLYYIHSAGAAFLIFCMVGLTINDLLGLLAKSNLGG